ncbi:hypothetical protein EDD85DRAFT_1027148 [Armillaria nabsnona]|nr:hypothetical protein EDD85DRAFT_1027148 [Armillaria nabsnona]
MLTEYSVLCINLPDALLQSDWTEMLKMIITEMIQLTHSTQLRNNGVQSDLGYTMNRVQHYLKVLLELHKGDVLMCPLFDSSDVVGTIIRAMKHRTSRAKAVEFLESLAKQDKDSDYSDEKGLRFMDLLTDIIELGRNIMSNNKRSIFAIFQSGGARSNVSALDPPAESLRTRILESENFEIISKSLDLHDIIQQHRGDRIEADIVRVKCLRALIAYYPDARRMMNADVIIPLLDLHQAFHEELASSQWLNTWTGYHNLLEETLMDLKKADEEDKKDSKFLGQDVRERLEQIYSRSQSVQTSKMGSANETGASEPPTKDRLSNHLQ